MSTNNFSLIPHAQKRYPTHLPLPDTLVFHFPDQDQIYFALEDNPVTVELSVKVNLIFARLLEHQAYNASSIPQFIDDTLDVLAEDGSYVGDDRATTKKAFLDVFKDISSLSMEAVEDPEREIKKVSQTTRKVSDLPIERDRLKETLQGTPQELLKEMGGATLEALINEWKHAPAGGNHLPSPADFGKKLPHAYKKRLGKLVLTKIIDHCAEKSERQLREEVARQKALEKQGHPIEYGLIGAYSESYIFFQGLKMPGKAMDYALDKLEQASDSAYDAEFKRQMKLQEQCGEFDLDALGTAAFNKVAVDCITKYPQILATEVLPKTWDFLKDFTKDLLDAVDKECYAVEGALQSLAQDIKHKILPHGDPKAQVPLPQEKKPASHPHFYLFVGEEIQKIWKPLKKNAPEQSGIISKAIQAQYPQAQVVKEGRCDQWRFWLVENEGKYTVFFPGTSRWMSTQLLDGARDQIRDKNTSPEKHPQLPAMQAQIDQWQQELNMKVDAVFGMSKGAYYAARIQGEELSHITLNGQGVQEGQYNFRTNQDDLTYYSGASKHCKSIGDGRHRYRNIAEKLAQDADFEEVYSGEYFIEKQQRMEVTAEKVSALSMPAEAKIEALNSLVEASQESASIPSEPEELLEKQEEAVQEILKEQIDWGKMAYEVGKSLVNDAVAYLHDRAETKKVSRQVQSFVKSYESEKRRLLQQIPEGEEGLRLSLTQFMHQIQRPERVVDSYANLEKAGQELSQAIAELKTAKAALLQAKERHLQDLKQLDALDERYKKALHKALGSARRAQRKVGLFSTILNTAGAILVAIPTPATQIAGGSLIAVTSAARHFTASNADEIRDSRVQKFQGRLTENNETRQDLVSALRHIALQVSEIDAAQLAYERWIFGPESASQLTVADRFKNLQSILDEKRATQWQVEDSIREQQARLPVLKTKAEEAEQQLAAVPEFQNSRAHWKRNEYQRRKEVLDSLKKEISDTEASIKALTEKDLVEAQKVVKEKETHIQHEEALKPLYHFRVKILQPFAQERKTGSVPTPAEYAAQTLQLYYQEQVNELSTAMNLLSASGELTRELYHSGYPLPHYIQSFAQHFVQCGASLDRLYKAHQARKEDPSAFNLNNWINLLIAPGIKSLSSLVALYNAATVIQFLVAQLGSKERQRTLFDHIQEELSNQIHHLSQWMEGQFDQCREQSEEVIKRIDLARTEQRRLMRLLSTHMDKNHQRILNEFQDDRYDDHVVSVKKRAEKYEALISLGDLTRALENCRSDLWNGYQWERSLTTGDTPTVWRPRIDLKHLPRNPFHLTGLMGQYLGVSSPLPNGRLLVALKAALERSVGKAESKAKIAAAIARMQKELIGLVKHIPTLMTALYKEQRALSLIFENNSTHTHSLKTQIVSAWIEKAKTQTFDDKPLGRKRHFLSDIVKTPLSRMLPRYDYSKIASDETIRHHGFSWVGKDALTYGGLMFVSPTLAMAACAYRCFMDYGPGAGYTLQRLTEAPLNQLIKPLKDKNLRTAVAQGDLQESDRTALLGIDLKERKVVPITNRESAETAVPFLVVKLYLRTYRFFAPVQQMRLSKPDHAVMRVKELHRIAATPIDERLYDPTALYSAYAEFLHEETSELKVKLGDFVLLPSKMNGQLPLAFPKAFLQHCENEISQEIRYAEMSRAGCFIPHYEFSPHTHRLSIVYSFSAFKDGSITPYCTVHAASFDAATIASFKKDLIADGSTETFNEFLLHALYGGYYSLGLPGDQTVSLKGLSAPADRAFPGLYPLLAKRPDTTLVYNSSKYDEDAAAALYEWALSSKQQLPKMLKEGIQPEFYPEFLEVRETLNGRIKQLIRSSTYEEKYYLLMALVKLFSNAHNEQIYEILQGGLSLYAPEHRDQVSLAMTLEEDIKAQIEDFMDLLEEFPSEEKLSLM